MLDGLVPNLGLESATLRMKERRKEGRKWSGAGGHLLSAFGLLFQRTISR